MQRRPAVVIRRAQILDHEHQYLQRLHPHAQPFPVAWLSRAAGLVGVGLSRGRLAPGTASFAYHAHLANPEWIYVLSGRGRARIDGLDVELGAGDFVGFPSPQVPHQLTNPYTEELEYLFGGGNPAVDLLDYPDLDRRFALVPEGRRVAFYPLGPAEYPFERLGATTPCKLFAQRGYGSVLVEAALTKAKLTYQRVEVDMDGPRTELRTHNPLGQLPTLLLPDGAVLTESLAITLWASEQAPDCGLAPAPGAPTRAAFLRWLTYFVAAIYPTFTFGDDPARFSSLPDDLRARVIAHRKALWQHVEAAASPTGPWFLGATWSAIDIYVCAMTHWGPGAAWFAEHTPRLSAIAAACRALPELAAVWAANFD